MSWLTWVALALMLGGWAIYCATIIRRAQRAERQVHNLRRDLAAARLVNDLANATGLSRQAVANQVARALVQDLQPLHRLGIGGRAPWWRRPWLRLTGWWEDRRG